MEGEQRKKLIVGEVGRYIEDGLSLEQACEVMDITPRDYSLWKLDYEVVPERKFKKRTYPRLIPQAKAEVVPDELKERKVYISQLSQFIKEAREE